MTAISFKGHLKVGLKGLVSEEFLEQLNQKITLSYTMSYQKGKCSENLYF